MQGESLERPFFLSKNGIKEKKNTHEFSDGEDDDQNEGNENDDDNEEEEVEEEAEEEEKEEEKQNNYIQTPSRFLQNNRCNIVRSIFNSNQTNNTQFSSNRQETRTINPETNFDFMDNLNNEESESNESHSNANSE